MTSAELDRMWERGARKIVSIEIINGSAPQAHGAFDPTPKVIATLVDGSKVELFSYRADDQGRSHTDSQANLECAWGWAPRLALYQLMCAGARPRTSSGAPRQR